MTLKLGFEERLEELRVQTGESRAIHGLDLIKEERVMHCLDFIEVCLQWVQGFFDVGKFGEMEYNFLEPLLFKKTFKAIRMFNRLEKPSYQNFEFIQSSMLMETRTLISTIVNWDKMDLADFNLLQFNLQKRLEKFSLIEEERTHLHNRLAGAKAKKQAEEKRQTEEAELEKALGGMTANEKRALLFKHFFPFTQSAVTPEERTLAIKKNRETVLRQREKVAGFQKKLAAAEEKARSSAGKEISEVVAVNQLYVMTRHKLEEQRFAKEEEKARQHVLKKREELKEFVHKTGIPKAVKRARKQVFASKKETMQQVEEEEMLFGKARENILEKKAELQDAETKSRRFIKEKGIAEIEHGHGIVEIAKKHLQDETRGSEQIIEGARQYLKTGERILKAEKNRLQGLVEEEEQRLSNAKARMQREQTGFAERRKREVQRIKSMEAKLVSGRKREAQRIAAFGESLLEKRTAIGGRRKTGGKPVPATVALPAKEKMAKGFGLKKEKMAADLTHRKDQLAYDVRFTKDRMQKMSKKYKDHAAEISEEFAEMQKKTIARHKARVKAQMIRSLLHAIRQTH